MGTYMYGDILKAKVYDILGGIEGVKIYIYDIMGLRKYKITKHIEYLRVIFSRLCNDGLKVNNKNSVWG